MTSDKDDLEQALQENLQLRRELGAQAAKASGGVAYRLGWLLYWACLATIAAWTVYVLLVHAYPIAREDGLFVDGLFSLVFAAIWFLVLPALALYALGRAVRYILSGK